MGGSTTAADCRKVLAMPLMFQGAVLVEDRLSAEMIEHQVWLVKHFPVLERCPQPSTVKPQPS